MHSLRFLPLLLLLTALQALGPLLHAHRDAVEFTGGLHLPGLAVAALADDGPGDAAAPAPVALHGDEAAFVSAVAGIEDRGSLLPVAAGPGPDPAPRIVPVREGRAARPPPVGAAVPESLHLRPLPQAPPLA